jgi:hypothetical protein
LRLGREKSTHPINSRIGQFPENNHLPVYFRVAEGAAAAKPKRVSALSKSRNRARRNPFRANAYKLSGNLISSHEFLARDNARRTAGRAAN